MSRVAMILEKIGIHSIQPDLWHYRRVESHGPLVSDFPNHDIRRYEARIGRTKPPTGTRLQAPNQVAGL